MLHSLRGLLIALCLLTTFAAGATGEVRQKLNFNPAWLVLAGDPAGASDPSFDDSHWKPVTLPHAWNEDSAFKVSIHDLPTGVAWYRKHFTLPSLPADARVFIEFEGIRQAGDVYVNGQLAGRNENGVMAFGFDLTRMLKPAPAVNVIAVRTDNRWDYRERATNTQFQWNNANFYANYGGIGKNVWLHITGPVYQTLPLFSGLGTTGIYIWASDFDLAQRSARITVESQVRNDSATPQALTLTVAIRNPEGRIVASFSGRTASAPIAPGATETLVVSSIVKDLNFWSWGYGYLYDVISTLKAGSGEVDRLVTRTGFRKTEFGNGMVKLNGRAIQFHGYAQRTTNEWPALGLSVPPWMSDLSNQMMVDSGSNLVRWMHVTPWKQDVESCDRVGLPESMPAGDAEGDPSGRRWQQRVELMRDAILYNRNNPSILFYESGNKGISEAHMADMKHVRDLYDPHGGRAIGAREMQDSTLAEYGGEMLYIDKSAAKPMWAHEYSRDEGSRKFWDEASPPFHKDAPLYNRNQDSHAIEDVRRWYDYYAARPGSGTRVTDGGVNIIFSDSNTHYRGDNNYRRSGEVDAMRIPKDGWYAHRVMWSGWVDIDPAASQPRLHILGHWSYPDATVKPVYVISSAQKVELLLNDKSLGFGKQTSRFLYTFDDVRFGPGTLTAVAYDGSGKRVGAASLKSAGAPAALRLTPHTAPGGLKADGADIALIDVEVVDAAGQRCPTALNLISFKLDGPAEWRGGIAQGSSVPVPRNVEPADSHGLAAINPTPFLHEDNYILASTLPVEGGVNRVMVRSSPVPGHIVVHASAEGLTGATIELNSKPFEVSGGIASAFPSDGLAASLARGPTPASPSYTDWRIAVPIASAHAGSNEAAARQSFDDNERTAWTSDGQTANAWIEYTFAKAQPIGEVELKLNAFRTRRYPLRITVGGKTVWEGVTPTSLGYCDLRFPPTSGSTLRIAMTGPPVDGPMADATAEITGKVDSGGTLAVAKDGKSVLNILEAEIYQPRTKDD